MSSLTRALGIIVVLCALIAVPTAMGARDPALVYSAQPAAGVVHDNLGTSLRQLPALPDRRWNGSRLLAKVRGRELAAAPSAEAMAAMLRARWRSERAAFVGVDEILPAHWSLGGAAMLETAMVLLGPEAGRVVFYAGPSMVEQVGRTDPRRTLSPKLGVLVNAMALARATYLMTYRGNGQPFPAREMATHPTRWVARWPAESERLRLLVGPDGGIGQHEVWSRVRSTPAGRRLLANGPGAYGLRGRAAARAWVDEYRSFLASPEVSPTGVDTKVPQPGGVGIGRMNERVVWVSLARAGRAVIRLVPRGQRRGRVIKALWGPTDGKRGILLPRDARPGSYTLVAVLQGDGLRDEARVPLALRP